MRYLLPIIVVFCLSCGAYAQSTTEPVNFNGTWSTCGFLADMTKVDTFTITKGEAEANNCTEADCASTTWTFSTIDGERTLKRRVSIGCEDGELQVSEEGDFGSWSYDPVAQQLVVVPYFEPEIYRYGVSLVNGAVIELRTWGATN